MDESLETKSQTNIPLGSDSVGVPLREGTVDGCLERRDGGGWIGPGSEHATSKKRGPRIGGGL